MTGGWGAVTLPHRLPVGRMPELAQEARRRHLGRWISGHVCLRSGLTGDRDSTLRGHNPQRRMGGWLGTDTSGSQVTGKWDHQ